MNSDRITKYVIISAGIAGALFLFPFFLNLFAPFIISFFIAAACQRLVRFLDRRLGINRSLSSAALVTLLVSAVLALLVIIAIRLFDQAKDILQSLPQTVDALRVRIASLTENLQEFKLTLPAEISNFIDSAILRAQEYTSNLSVKVTSAALDGAAALASRLPDIFVFSSMLLLGTFFFLKDYQLVINFLKDLLPNRVIAWGVSAKNIIIQAFSSYIKAQLILMSLTAVLVTVSLWIVGKENALLWGLICGLVDAIPLLGTAIVLVPWAIISLIYGDIFSFVTLLIIQIFVFVVRQLAEPKVLSRQIGVHPLITLIGIYIGLRYFGLAGAILAPIFALFMVNLYITYKEKT